MASSATLHVRPGSHGTTSGRGEAVRSRKPSAIDIAASSSSDPRDAQCTCARVRRLARRVTQLYDHVLAPSGLRVTQYSLLTQLLGQDGIGMGPLAAVLDMERTTLTRNLRPLLDAGLVELAPGSTDARVRVVRLTRAGRARHAKAARLWRVAQDQVDRTLGKREVASLHRLFDGLIETFHAQDGAAPT